MEGRGGRERGKGKEGKEKGVGIEERSIVVARKGK